MARILALGGTHRAGSSTEMAMRAVARHCQEHGAQIEIIAGPELADFPIFGTAASETHARGHELAMAAYGADAILIASPGYHGGISGLVKNALDYLELLSGHTPAYLENKAVGLIATAYGSQAAMSTLQSLRTTVHALRGWPTPLGVAAVCQSSSFDAEGHPMDTKLGGQLTILAEQLLQGAEMISA